MLILMNIYLIFFIVIMSWSLPSFISKDLTKYMGNIELFIFYHIIFHSIILAFIIYIFIFKRDKVFKFQKSIKKIPLSLVGYTIGIVLLILVSRIIYYELLRKLDINTILPIVRGGSTVVVILVGYLFYKERFSFLKLVGIFTVFCGIYLVNQY